MKIKMAAFDLDGTLLRTDKTVSERTVLVLKKCREKGIKIIYATGRGDSAKTLAPAELFDGFIRMNGAAAYIGGDLVYSRLIPMDKVRDLLIAADSAKIKIAAEYNGHYANFNVNELWPSLGSRFEFADFRTLDIAAEKIYAVIEKPQDLELISGYLPDDVHCHAARDNLAMIMHREASKSLALAVLAKHWGINPDEIAAFGDDVNDIDLLQFCGAGVAVSNALDEVKEAAGYICGSNDEDGPAKWIEENIL